MFSHVCSLLVLVLLWLLMAQKKLTTKRICSQLLRQLVDTLGQFPGYTYVASILQQNWGFVYSVICYFSESQIAWGSLAKCAADLSENL